MPGLHGTLPVLCGEGSAPRVHPWRAGWGMGYCVRRPPATMLAPSCAQGKAVTSIACGAEHSVAATQDGEVGGHNARTRRQG